MLPLLPLRYVGVVEGNSIKLPNAIDRNLGVTLWKVLPDFFLIICPYKPGQTF